MWFAFAALKSPGPLSGSAETVVPRDGAADGSGGMRLGRGGAAAAGAGRRKPFFAWFPPPGEAERESLRVPCGGRRDPSGALALGFPLGPDFFRSPAAHSPEPPGYRPFYPLRAQADETRIFPPLLYRRRRFALPPGSSRIKSNFLLREAILPHSTFCSVQFLHRDRFAPYHRQRCVITGRQNSCIARNAPGFSPRSRI